MQASALVELIGTWSAGSQPLNEQLATALQRLIDAGTLPAGLRLPSEREIAAALGISRTTVVAAYDRLRVSGSARSRRGSGTRVAWRQPAAPPATARRSVTPGDTRRPVLGYEDDGPDDAIQLTIGAFRAPSIVADEIEAAGRLDARQALRYFGYLPAGLPALRAAVASHLADLGVPTMPEQVVITNGAQQAIDIVARTLGEDAGSVIIENPAYPGAIQAFRSAGPRLVPVPLDDDGPVVELVALHAARRPHQLLYVVPICQNPLGTVMSAQRGQELIRTASDHALLIVEDLTPAYLTFDGSAPLPLAAMDDTDQVVTIGSLSKVAWGGIRIGWIRAPRALAARFVTTKSEMDLGTGLLSQAVALRLLGRLADLGAIARRTAVERHAVLTAALATKLPSWRWEPPRGGICLWVRLPSGDGTAFTRLASEFGVIVRAGTTLSVDGSFTDRIRIAFGEEPDRLREAVDRLAAAWAAFEPRVASARPEPPVSV